MGKLEFTGDPLVDVGALVMNTLPQKSIEDKIRFVTDVYVDRWSGKIDTVFLHSKITHPPFRKDKKKQREGSLHYYADVLNGKLADSEGYCRICGRKGLLFVSGRHNYPMAGSGDFVNFHHIHEEGLFLCKDCLVKLYFLPMGVLQCGGNLILLQVKDQYTAQLWQEDIIKKILDKIHIGSSGGMLSSSFFNPHNALFHFAANLIIKFELFDKPSQPIRLFYFTNFGNKANVDIYDIPNNVFSFLKRVLKPDIREAWSYFVKSHYSFSKRRSIHFDKATKEWVEIKKKEAIELSMEDYEGKNSNTVYEYLLSGRSILRSLCRMHKSEKFPIMVAIIYLKEVRKMRQEQINLIQTISDKIIALCRQENNFKKFITPLEGARYAHQLRAAILRFVKVHYKNGETEPFVRFNDYVEYLFPDAQSWYETRDFLLISLYEKLHDLRVDPTQVSDEVEFDMPDEEKTSIEAFNQ